MVVTSGASFYDEIDDLYTFTCTIDIVKWSSMFIQFDSDHYLPSLKNPKRID